MHDDELSVPKRVIAVEIRIDVELKNELLPAVLVTQTASGSDYEALRAKHLQKYLPIRTINEGTSRHYCTKKSELKAAKKIARKLLSNLGYTVYTGGRREIYVVSLTSFDSEKWVYVGETGISITKRIQQHKAGGKSAAKVWNRMEKRIPALEPKRTYWSTEDSENAETEWGLHLYALGFRVVGPRGFNRKTGQPDFEK